MYKPHHYMMPKELHLKAPNFFASHRIDTHLGGSYLGIGLAQWLPFPAFHFCGLDPGSNPTTDQSLDVDWVSFHIEN